MTEPVQAAIARRFQAAVATGDLDTIRSLLAADIRWTLPGDNQISDEAVGPDAVIAKLLKIATFAVRYDLKAVLLGRDNFALAFHNEAERGEVRLDEDLTTVCRLQNGLISAIETYVSDIANMDAFYAR